MNKYKIVSLVLAVALIATLARLVYTTNVAVPVGTDTKQAVLDNIYARKSVRSYSDRPVSRAQLDTLVRAAMAAPTGRDMRPWRFVVIDDSVTLDSLSARLPRARMLKEAKAAIVVCGDMSVTDDKGKPSNSWMLDCSAATENLLLAAEAMGLGAVWTGAYPNDDRIAAIRAAVGLPDHITPLSLVPIGYPKGNPQPKDKFDQNNIHYNTW